PRAGRTASRWASRRCRARTASSIRARRPGRSLRDGTRPASSPAAGAGWSGSAAGSPAPSTTRPSTSPSTWRTRRTPTASAPRGRPSQIRPGLPDPTWAPDVDVRAWSDAVSRTLLAERVVPGLRIPDAAGYLDDLAKGRTAALAGQSPQQAFEAVARAWDKR